MYKENDFITVSWEKNILKKLEMYKENDFITVSYEKKILRKFEIFNLERIWLQFKEKNFKYSIL